MATIQQILANRQNAQSSTGPRTAEGKLASSRNSFKSGIYAESELIPGEDPVQLETLKSEYYERFHPATVEARELTDSLIRSTWLLRRLSTAEAAIFRIPVAGIDPADTGAAIAAHYFNSSRQLEAIQRRINAVNRNYHRDLKALQSLPRPDAAPAQPAEAKAPEPDFASFLHAYLNPPYMSTPLDLGPVTEADLYGGSDEDTPEDLAA